MEKVEGKLFIIPNRAKSLDDIGKLPIQLKAWFPKQVNDPEERWVNVQAFSHHSENWSNHGVKWLANGSKKDAGAFPALMPLSLLKGVEEGDTLKLVSPEKIVVRLLCRQMVTRYNFRDFGGMIEYVTSK